MSNPGRDRVGCRFWLVRAEDESGVSGTGVVADGVLFPSGCAVIEWRNDVNEAVDTSGNGLAIYPGDDGLEDALEVHGHGGRTEVEFADDVEAAAERGETA